MTLPLAEQSRYRKDMEKKVYKNGSLILRDSVAQGMAVLTHGGEIYAIVPENTPVSEDYRVVDLGGQYLAPGFVELHTHGAGGADFMDAGSRAARDDGSLSDDAVGGI